MAFQVVALLAVLAAAQAAPQLLAKTDGLDVFDPHPKYAFSYDVSDALTGDAKSQTEARDGDVVQGSYSLIEADGSKRIVDYTADDINGFNAVVHKEALGAGVRTIDPSPIALTKSIIAKTPIIAKSPFGFAKSVYGLPGNPLAFAPKTFLGASPYAAPYAAPVFHAGLSTPFSSYAF